MSFTEKVLSVFQTNALLLALQILVLFIILYFVMSVLKSNNADLLNIIFIIFTIGVGILFIVGDNVENFLFIFFPALFIMAMIAMFSTEIKREIWNLSTKKSADPKHQDVTNDKNTVKESTNEIIKALQNMSKNDVGALIILASATMPNSIMESGVYMNCEISSALIESVFFPKTPLHDGAMILKGNRILSAGCFLPLSQEVNIPKDLGTRHRAGIGITETIDVTAIIVSEETGVISIANGGKLKRYADSEMLRQTLTKFFAQEAIAAAAKGKGE